MNTILVVDDEPNYLIVLSELLKEEGYEVITAQKGEDGLKVVQDTDLDLVITDMRMPGMDGLELLKTVKSYNKDLPVIMITAVGEVEKAVVAMKALPGVHCELQPSASSSLPSSHSSTPSWT